MKYVLTILSSGRPTYLERTLTAYAKFLTPPPSAVYLYDDGRTLEFSPTSEPLQPVYDVWEYPDPLPSVTVESSPERIGQCAAQAECWQAAAESGCEWVFHVEDDVVLLRPLDLRDLAAVLDAEPAVAQMALVRCPWGAEIEYGGYIPMMPGLYERRETEAVALDFRRAVGGDDEPERFEWIATLRNWSNSGLWRTQLCRDFAFPAEPGCETTLGPALLGAGYEAFGLWGHGEPWVAHIGVERAPGSHGY